MNHDENPTGGINGSWDTFTRVIEKASMACEKAGQTIEPHFFQTGKLVRIGSGAEREVEDYALSRYACYPIVQNGDPTKTVIANGQTYFSMQTRHCSFNFHEPHGTRAAVLFALNCFVSRCTPDKVANHSWFWFFPTCKGCL